MKRISRLAVIGVSAAMLTGSGASLALAAHRHGVHKHRLNYASRSAAPAGPVAGSQADPAPTPGSIGSYYGGLGSSYDNSAFGYNGPLGGGLRASAQIGSGLVGGGALGDAYANYVQHLYYYKYDYCQLGSAYVWYLQRCVSPLDLFR